MAPSARHLCGRLILVGLILAPALTAAPGIASAGPVVLRPSISLSEQYNDNIFFSEDATHDFVTTLGLGLNMSYRRPRFRSSLFANTAARVFARDTSQDKFFDAQTAGLRASYEATPRLSFSVGDSFRRVRRTRTGAPLLLEETDTPPGDRDPQTEQPAADVQASTVLPRGDALSNSFDAGATYRFTPRWSGNASYNNEFLNFADPSGQDLVNRAGFGVGYAQTPHLSFTGSYRFSDFDLSDTNDSQSHVATVGFVYYPAERWTVSGDIGAFVNRSQGDESDRISDSVGPAGNLAVIKTGERWSLRAGFGQNITTSAGVAGVSLTRNAYVAGQARLYRRLSGSLTTSLGDFDTAEADFRVVALRVALTQPIGRYFSVGIAYTYRWRDSDSDIPDRIEEGTVDGNIIQIFASASYPLWRGNL